MQCNYSLSILQQIINEYRRKYVGLAFFQFYSRSSKDYPKMLNRYSKDTFNSIVDHPALSKALILSSSSLSILQQIIRNTVWLSNAISSATFQFYSRSSHQCSSQRQVVMGYQLSILQQIIKWQDRHCFDRPSPLSILQQIIVGDEIKRVVVKDVSTFNSIVDHPTFVICGFDVKCFTFNSIVDHHFIYIGVLKTSLDSFQFYSRSSRGDMRRQLSATHRPLSILQQIIEKIRVASRGNWWLYAFNSIVDHRLYFFVLI